MNTKLRILITLLVAAAATAALVLKPEPAAPQASQPALSASSPGLSSKGLPHLVDVGAGKCIPCKAMKPILDSLAVDYAERFETTFIDVLENPDAGKAHGARIIPTQIFYDEQGQELFRHEGFFSKEDILETWATLGYNMDGEVCCAH